MNWGGIIAGALGGGAKAAYEIADTAEKRQQRLADFELGRQARREDRLWDMEAAQRAADEKLRLYVRDYERVQDRAAQIGQQRDAMALGQINDQIQGDSPQATDAEIQRLLAENPEYRAVYERAGYLDPQKQSSLVADKIQAAREVGAVPEVRKDLADTYARTLQAERDAERAEIDRRREDRRDSEFAALLPIRQQTADAATARANRPPASGGGSSKPPATSPARMPVERLTQEAETIRKAIKDMRFDDPRRADYQARLDGVLDELKRRREGGQPVPSQGPSGDNRGQTPTNQPKIGDRRSVQSGPHKGKTVEWDGKGWVLVN